ncbi:MAG: DUF2851 family protein, partial [Verrucomicrobia bacterium]|nr:DUF2851 family protein [Verrucomicrobiota bacterium]
VVLHVFWQADPAISDTPSIQIRPIALEHQLAAPLTELISLFHATPGEIAGGEKPGRCHQILLALSSDQLREVLEEAGWHRLRQRRVLATARISAHGFEQAVWVALAEGLGFSENREPFASLARAVPIADLLQLPTRLDRESLLYGVAGLLPDPTRTKCSPRALPLLKELWSRWWPHRETWSDRVLPHSCWRMGSTRPNNSTHRRMAALSFFSDPPTWQGWIDSVRRGESDNFLNTLKSASHSFWDQHAGWDGRILSSPSRLVGLDRATALLFQVLAPLTELPEDELDRRMKGWPPGGDAGLLRSASVRLLSVPFPPPDVRSHLAREGLLQIYKDFCRAKPCGDCSMPEFLNNR